MRTKYKKKRTVLNLRYLPANLPQNLSSPPLAFPQTLTRTGHLRSPVRPGTQPKFGRLGLSEPVEHGLRLFLISSLKCRDAFQQAYKMTFR